VYSFVLNIYTCCSVTGICVTR